MSIEWACIFLWVFVLWKEIEFVKKQNPYFQNVCFSLDHAAVFPIPQFLYIR